MNCPNLELAREATIWGFVLLWGSGCANGPRFPHTPAYSRPITCPDNPVTYRGPNREDLRQGDAVRCSYADYGETRGVYLKGRLVHESKDSLVGIPAEGLIISVHPDKGSLQSSLAAPKQKKWETLSDAQGKFVLNAVLDPGSYVLVARERGSGLSRAYRRIVVQPQHSATMVGLDMVIPLGAAEFPPVSNQPFPIESVPLPPKFPTKPTTTPPDSSFSES